MLDQLTKPGENFAGKTEFPEGANTPIDIAPGPASGLLDERGRPIPGNLAVTAGDEPEPIISPNQPATSLIQMKREQGNDFTKWSPLNPQREMGTARKAYHLIDAAQDQALPGTAQLNQEASSLITAKNRAKQTDLNAGWAQRVGHKMAAHTGAMVGAYAAYNHGGIIPAIAATVIPEALASPTSRMITARGLYGTGKLAGTPGMAQLSQIGAAANNVRPATTPDPLDINDYIDQDQQ
jgi:hypothetical protein